MCTDMGAPPTRRGTYMCTDMRVHTHTHTEFSVVGNPAWYTGEKRGVVRQCLIAVEGGAVRTINFFQEYGQEFHLWKILLHSFHMGRGKTLIYQV